MPNIGPLELAIILVIVLIVFGPKRLPGLGRQLGGGLREFKDSLTGDKKDDDDDERDAAGDRRTLPEAAPAEQRAAAPRDPEAAPAEQRAAAPREPEVVTGEARPDDRAGSPRTDA